MGDLISVIIPVYNREDLIEETLKSVKLQTHQNWECIIVDDGSIDQTVEVIQRFIADDSRFVFYQRPASRKKGASPCRNYGLELAKGDFVQFLDSDDLLHPGKFEEQLRLIQKEPGGAISTCKWGSFKTAAKLNVKTKWHAYGDYKNSLKLLDKFGKYNEYFPPIVYLVPTSVINKAGKWDETLEKNPNDDGEFFTRIILNATKVVFCDSTEVYYRAGESERLSLLDSEEKIRSVIESWRMIQHNLKDHEKICRRYTSNGIRNVYEEIKITHPELLKEYAEFFEKNIIQSKWYHRFTGNKTSPF